MGPNFFFFFFFLTQENEPSLLKMSPRRDYTWPKANTNTKAQKANTMPKDEISLLEGHHSD
jgi:hypothetical protein